MILIGIIVKKDDEVYIGEGGIPIDEHGAGCHPYSVEQIDLIRGKITISFTIESRWTMNATFYLSKISEDELENLKFKRR